MGFNVENARGVIGVGYGYLVGMFAWAVGKPDFALIILALIFVGVLYAGVKREKGVN